MIMLYLRGKAIAVSETTALFCASLPQCSHWIFFYSEDDEDGK